MKASTLLVSLACAAALARWAGAQSESPLPPDASSGAVSEKASVVGMLPHQKQGKPLDAKERNPFAELVRVEAVGEAEDTSTEESNIRAVLASLKVSGVTRGDAGAMKAQLGSFILEEGRELEQIIPNQTDVLKVTKVSEKLVEITWVDVEGSEQPRKHIIELDLSPKVLTRLPSPGGESDGGPLSPVDPRASEKRALNRIELASPNDSPSPVE